MNRRFAISLALAMLLSVLAVSSRTVGAEEPADTAALLLQAASPLGDRSLGSESAPVIMIEYASATCPHCAEFHQTLLPQIKAEYIETGKVRFIFREFPLDQLALGAFMLLRCLPEDKYFPTLDLMFRQQRNWAQSKNPADDLFKITRMAGMDQAGFEACIKREDLGKAIVESSRKAAKDFGIKGTPAIFINGTAIDAHEDVAAVKKAIDKALGQ